jgi:hypothetical protein
MPLLHKLQWGLANSCTEGGSLLNEPFNECPVHVSYVLTVEATSKGIADTQTHRHSPTQTPPHPTATPIHTHTRPHAPHTHARPQTHALSPHTRTHSFPSFRSGSSEGPIYIWITIAAVSAHFLLAAAAVIYTCSGDPSGEGLAFYNFFYRETHTDHYCMQRHIDYMYICMHGEILSRRKPQTPRK